MRAKIRIPAAPAAGTSASVPCVAALRCSDADGRSGDCGRTVPPRPSADRAPRARSGQSRESPTDCPPPSQTARRHRYTRHTCWYSPLAAASCCRWHRIQRDGWVSAARSASGDTAASRSRAPC